MRKDKPFSSFNFSPSLLFSPWEPAHGFFFRAPHLFTIQGRRPGSSRLRPRSPGKTRCPRHRQTASGIRGRHAGGLDRRRPHPRYPVRSRQEHHPRRAALQPADRCGEVARRPAPLLHADRPAGPLCQQPERSDRRLQLVAHVRDEVTANALDAARFGDVTRECDRAHYFTVST